MFHQVFQSGNDRVRCGLQAAKEVGEDIRPVASDIQAGQLVLEEGELIGEAEVGILATVGAATLQVNPFQDIAW